MAQQLATLTHAGSIATLMINRPEARNALSVGVLEALHERVEEARGLERASVLVVAGAGKAFCAGMDLKQVLAEQAAATPLQLLTSLAELAVKLRALPMLTVASVNGAAIGGGCGLACVCDFAVTHADAKLGFPEVDLGVCPAVVAPWLVRKVGAGRARQILLRGGLMNGQEALRLGLVNVCVETSDALELSVQGLAEKLSQGGPHALRATKRLLNELDGSDDLELARRCATVSAEVLNTPETRAMLRAKMGE